MKMTRQRAIAVLSVFTALLVISLMQLRGLRFTYDIESFFNQDDPEVKFYRQLKTYFGTENDFILVAVEANDTTIWNLAFLNRVQTFSQTLKDISGVSQLSNPLEYQRSKFTPLGWVKWPLVHLDDGEALARDVKFIRESKWMHGSWFAENEQSILLKLNLSDTLINQRYAVLVSEIKEQAKGHGLSVHMAGRAVTQTYYQQLMANESKWFLLAAISLMAVVLFITFRVWWAVMVPLLIVGVAVICCCAVLVLTGNGMDLILGMMPTVLLVIGISSVIHFLTKYIDAIRVGKQKYEAINHAIALLLRPGMLTSLTTAVGFAALLVVPVPPLQRFGWVVALGVLAVFPLTYLVLPAVLWFTSSPGVVHHKSARSIWHKRLQRWFVTMWRKRNAVIGIFIAGIVLSVLGWSRLQTDNRFLDDLDQEDGLIQDMGFIEDHFMGIRPYLLGVQLLEDRRLSDWDVLQEIQALTTYMRDSLSLHTSHDPSHLAALMNQSYRGGRAESYDFPARREWSKVASAVGQKRLDRMMSDFLDTTGAWIQLIARGADKGGVHYWSESLKLQQWMRRQDFISIRPTISGAAHLMDKANAHISQQLLAGIGLAVIIVAVLLGFLYRSISTVLLAILPNFLPLIVMAGVMGFLGVHLKVSTAMVFTIVFGIALDDTIHFLARFRHETKLTNQPFEALRKTYLYTGRAIVLSTLVLCAGFVVLSFSHFASSKYLGVFTVVGLLTALIADLFLLPLLLSKHSQFKKGKSNPVKGRGPDQNLDGKARNLSDITPR